MTGTLRPTARNPVAVLLMGLLTLVFLILGIGGGGGGLGGAFRGIDANAVIVAGQHVTNQHDFKRAFDQQARDISQRQGQGQQIPVSVLVENGLDQQLLNHMAGQQSEVEMLRRAGIRPADSLIDDVIRKQQAFQDPISGKFSEKAFAEAIANQGLTPRDVTNLIRDGIAAEHLAGAMRFGFRAPRLYAAVAAVQAFDTRDVSFFVMDAHTVPAPAAPTDAQLLAFQKEHADHYTVPETRVITLVRFSPKALEPSIVIDQAALNKEFEFKKDTFSKPETRSLVQIPVKSPAEAAAVSARLGKGEDPSAVAASLGAQAVTYADKPRSAVVDAKVAAAAFGMKPGQIATVQGDLSLDVVKVDKITPGQEATLESVRPQLEASLRERGARDKAADMSAKFQDARDAGAGIADAAQKAGATAVTIGPVTAQGVGADGKPNPLLTDKILKSAFSEAAGGQGTDVQNVDAGESFALRVDKINAPALPPLDQARAQLTRDYINNAIGVALKAKAEGLLAAMRKGATIEAAAAQVGGHVTHQVGLQRMQAQKYAQAVGGEFVESVFGGKAGDVFAAAAPTGLFVAKLDAIRTGDPTQMARAVQTVAPRVADGYTGDLDNSVQTAATAVIKPRTNLNRAREALNLDQATIDKLNAKPGATPAKSPAP
ncbi:MAG: peptidyl-prolyl cis-trans isomerase [Proteobacteria bacterium]|nr:peptidyl-prolyl cis-trans isomerase [Pseudomonadota bacterium]